MKEFLKCFFTQVIESCFSLEFPISQLFLKVFSREISSLLTQKVATAAEKNLLLELIKISMYNLLDKIEKF